MIPDIEELFKTYADWIAWLRNKRTELETQRAKLKGQTEPGAAPVPDAVSDPQTGQIEAVTHQPPQAQADASALPETVPMPSQTEKEDLPDWL